MSTHLRHCPKHRKPLPCPHCAMVAAAPKPEPATEPVKRGRGRPAKYASEEDRKAADATRQRGERVVKKAEEIIAAHPDDLGSIGELSGGYGSQKIEQIVGAQQAAEAIGLGSDRQKDEYGGTTELSPPDRKRTSVPIPMEGKDDEDWEPDAATVEREDVFIEGAMRKNASDLRAWMNWYRLKKRECPSKDKHHEWARKYKDSPTKVGCKKCGKLLVNPGKWIVGADGKRDRIFSDKPRIPLSPLN